MSPTERFDLLQEQHPTPWQTVCQYVAGNYYPTHIVDANGTKVMECNWASMTDVGKHTYACIVESVNARVQYGNPWSSKPNIGVE